MGVVAGTAGHVDHGKSSLMRWLTGVDPDRLKEEKLRGITIELGYVFLPLPGGGVLGFIDVPGHERFVRQMVAGVATIDFFLLVVAADEGVMQQTREHLDILQILGVSRGLVALTKCDIAEPDIQDVAEAEVEDLLAGRPLESAGTFRVSSVTGEGMEELRSALVDMAGTITHDSAGERFRLAIDRVFTLQGHGTVVCGTVLSGSVSTGDSVELLPGGRVHRVRELRVNEGRMKGAGTPGDRVALNLVGLEREDARRGSCLATPGWLQTVPALDAECSLLPAGGLETRQRVRFHCGTAEVMARAVPMDGADMPPGSSGFVHFQLEEPVVALPGDRFVIRRFSPVTTIGGGVVLESGTAKVRQRNREDRLRRIGMLAEGDIAGVILSHLKERSLAGVSPGEMSREMGKSEQEILQALGFLSDEGLARRLRDGSGERVVLESAFEEAGERLAAALDSWHAEKPLSPGMPSGHVGRLFPGYPQWFVKGLVGSLADQERVRRVDDRLVSAAFTGEIPENLAEAVRKVLEEIEEAGFAGLETGGRDQAMMEALLERGMVLELEKGLITVRSVAERAWKVLGGTFGSSEFRLGELREALGVPRRTAVLWAGLLDALGLTIRSGELRTAAVRE